MGGEEAADRVWHVAHSQASPTRLCVTLDKKRRQGSFVVEQLGAWEKNFLLPRHTPIYFSLSLSPSYSPSPWWLLPSLSLPGRLEGAASYPPRPSFHSFVWFPLVDGGKQAALPVIPPLCLPPPFENLWTIWERAFVSFTD